MKKKVLSLMLGILLVAMFVVAENNDNNTPQNAILSLDISTFDLSSFVDDKNEVSAIVLSSDSAIIKIDNENVKKLIYTFDEDVKGFYYEKDNELTKVNGDNLVIKIRGKDLELVPVENFGQQQELSDEQKTLILNTVGNTNLDLDSLNVLGISVPDNADYAMKVDDMNAKTIIVSDDSSLVLIANDEEMVSKSLPLEIRLELREPQSNDAEAAVQEAGERAGETVPAEEQPEKLCLDNDEVGDSYFVPSYVKEFVPSDGGYNERTIADWCAVQEISQGEYKSTLYEWKCEDNKAKVEQVFCSDFDEYDENGNLIKDYECFKGACVDTLKETDAITRFCFDPDPLTIGEQTDQGWKTAFENTFGKQRVTVGFYAPEEVYEKSEKKDYCVDDDTLIEYYCSNAVTLFRQVTCKCSDGRCVEPPYCYETDGGISENFKGSIKAVSKEGQFFSDVDKCDDNTLKEYYCTLDNDNGYAIQDIECSGKCEDGRCVECTDNSDCGTGKVCSNGACVESECNDVCEPNIDGMVAYFGFEKDACDSITNNLAESVGINFGNGKIGEAALVLGKPPAKQDLNQDTSSQQPGKMYSSLPDRTNSQDHTSYLKLENQIGFENGESFSLECWVKTGGSGIQNCIRSQNNSDDNKALFGLRLVDGQANFLLRDKDGLSTANNYVNRYGALDMLAKTKDGGLLNDNNWHHIVAVMDATNKEARLYVDGELVNSTSTEGIGLSEDIVPNQPVYIGVYGEVSQDSNSVNLIEQFNGSLDEVAIYNVYLTDSVISAHYNADDHYCLCQNDNECSEGNVCIYGYCTPPGTGVAQPHCTSDNDCADGQTCDMNSLECVSAEVEDCYSCHENNPFAIWHWSGQCDGDVPNDAELLWCPSNNYCQDNACVVEELNDMGDVKTALERRLSWAEWLNEMLGKAEQQNGGNNLADVTELEADFYGLINALGSKESIANEMTITETGTSSNENNQGKPNGETCTGDLQCESGICFIASTDRQGGVCSPGSENSPCLNDLDCQLGYECKAFGAESPLDKKCTAVSSTSEGSEEQSQPSSSPGGGRHDDNTASPGNRRQLK